MLLTAMSANTSQKARGKMFDYKKLDNGNMEVKEKYKGFSSRSKINQKERGRIQLREILSFSRESLQSVLDNRSLIKNNNDKTVKNRN